MSYNKKILSTNCEKQTYTNYNKSFKNNAHVQYGWVCPRCGKVLAPWMNYCDCYNTDCVNTSTSEAKDYVNHMNDKYSKFAEV